MPPMGILRRARATQACHIGYATGAASARGPAAHGAPPTNTGAASARGPAAHGAPPTDTHPHSRNLSVMYCVMLPPGAYSMTRPKWWEVSTTSSGVMMLWWPSPSSDCSRISLPRRGRGGKQGHGVERVTQLACSNAQWAGKGHMPLAQATRLLPRHGLTLAGKVCLLITSLYYESTVKGDARASGAWLRQAWGREVLLAGCVHLC